MRAVEEERPTDPEQPQPTDESPVEEELHLSEEADVSLGPLFTLGAVLLIYGLLRRRPLVMAAGIGVRLARPALGAGAVLEDACPRHRRGEDQGARAGLTVGSHGPMRVGGSPSTS